MKSAMRSMLIVGLALILSAPLFAQEEKPKKKNKAKAKSVAASAFDAPKGVELSAEQTAKLEELKKSFEPKLAEVQRLIDAAITPELRKARNEAQKAAKQAGKKGKELKEAVAAAGNLTDEQKALVKQADEAVTALQKEIRQSVLGLLTDEQRAQVKQAKKKKNAP